MAYKNLELRRKTMNAYRKKHKKEINAYYRNRYEKYPAKRIARSKRYYQNNTETCKARSKAWAAANPDKVKRLAHEGYLRRKKLGKS
jgi:hypothetical protein